MAIRPRFTEDTAPGYSPNEIDAANAAFDEITSALCEHLAEQILMAIDAGANDAAGIIATIEGATLHAPLYELPQRDEPRRGSHPRRRRSSARYSTSTALDAEHWP